MLDYFSTKGFKDYVKVAARILDGNWTNSYTKPSASLYPHQWNWDSGFIAIGYAHYNEKRAVKELLSLFDHQWANGMIPHIVFNPQALGSYFPEPDFWQVPGGMLTSGITQPPLHAIACWHVYESASKKERALEFLRELFPKLCASHRYLYENRDPEHSGLVYIRHPWESGMDNSPAWDGPLGRIDVDKRSLPPYERKDLAQEVPSDQRPRDDDYDRYVYLVNLFRRLKYREEDIRRECPFLVIDVLFNSVLCRANHDLLAIANLLHEDTVEIRQWLGQTSKSILEQLWCRKCRKFESIDLITGKHIHTATASSFMPLFGRAASREQAEILYETINSISFCALHQGNCFTIPNYDMTRDDFDSRNYWRGPIWININWMLSRGLKGYGYNEKADAMKRDIIQLPIRFGFHEYFDSQMGKGYGSPKFSWTAALFLDLVYEYYQEDKHRFYWPKPTQRGRLKNRKILNPSVNNEVSTPKGVASNLMASIGELKERFYDLNRGRIDYRKMKDSDEYRNYKQRVTMLYGFDLRDLTSREEKLAFWINLYNTIVVHGIVELEISSSVREIPDFFKNIYYQIGEFSFSPEEMEHGILRANARPPYRPFPLFRRTDPRRQFILKEVDPRVHFTLVCGSRSCAPIRFYDAEKIDEQLEKATRNFVNSSEVIILPEENKVFLSQIFSWYARDFGGRKNILQFLLSYLDRDEKSFFLKKNWDSITVEHLFYDWNLNH